MGILDFIYILKICLRGFFVSNLQGTVSICLTLDCGPLSKSFLLTTKKLFEMEFLASLLAVFSLYQISWIFVINQVPCVSSCWGRRHIPVVCNESGEPHTSHYTSRPVTKKNNQQTTQTSHYAVDRWNFLAVVENVRL